MAEFTEVTAAFTVIVGLATLALAIITAKYVQETRLIRIAGQSPSFSLEPNLYVLGGQFLFLDLVNTGQAASRISLDCSWPNGSKKFYILSLGNQGRTFLNDIPIAGIVHSRWKLTIDISCFDARNKPYTTKLEPDFGKDKDADTVVSYQSSHLGNIVEGMGEIKKVLNLLNKTVAKSIDSIKPPLSISIKMSKNPLAIGDEQNITILVSEAKTGKRIIGANINFILISPGGSKHENTIAMTDQFGSFQVIFTFNELHEIGEYQLLVWTYKNDYQADVAASAFNAVEKISSG